MQLLQALAGDVGVDLRGRQVAVPKQHLYDPQVGAMVQQMRREGMPQGVRRQRLVDAGLLVRVTGHELSTSYGFHILWPKGKDLSPQARRVRDWMAEEAAKAQADAARSIPPAQKSINVPR